MKLLLLLPLAAGLAACADVTAPVADKAEGKAHVLKGSDITCRSGYIIAYDEDGNPYCTPN